MSDWAAAPAVPQLWNRTSLRGDRKRNPCYCQRAEAGKGVAGGAGSGGLEGVGRLERFI